MFHPGCNAEMEQDGVEIVTLIKEEDYGKTTFSSLPRFFLPVYASRKAGHLNKFPLGCYSITMKRYICKT